MPDKNRINNFNNKYNDLLKLYQIEGSYEKKGIIGDRLFSLCKYFYADYKYYKNQMQYGIKMSLAEPIRRYDPSTKNVSIHEETDTDLDKGHTLDNEEKSVETSHESWRPSKPRSLPRNIEIKIPAKPREINYTLDDFNKICLELFGIEYDPDNSEMRIAVYQVIASNPGVSKETRQFYLDKLQKSDLRHPIDEQLFDDKPRSR